MGVETVTEQNNKPRLYSNQGNGNQNHQEIPVYNNLIGKN